jgi:hypothetical protein
VRDVLYLAIPVAFFALATLLVAGCARIVGRTDVPEAPER